MIHGYGGTPDHGTQDSGHQADAGGLTRRGEAATIVRPRTGTPSQERGMTSTSSEQQDTPLPGLEHDLDEAIALEPSEVYLERSRTRRFMTRHGMTDYDALLARAAADPAWYWGAVAEDLELV